MNETGRAAVAKWLAGTGYPLEMRVASAFRAQGLTAHQSLPYRDALEGKLREADVLGRVSGAFNQYEKPHLSAMWSLSTVVECKAPQSGKPWVVLSPKHGLVSLLPTLDEAALIDKGPGSGPVLQRLGRVLAANLELDKQQRIGTAVLVAHTSSDSKDASMSASNALQQAVSAAHGLHQALRAADDGRLDLTHVTLPVLATSGELVAARLDEDGGAIVEDLDHAWVRVAHLASDSPPAVLVATEDYLTRSFVPGLRQIVDEMQLLASGDIQFVQ